MDECYCFISVHYDNKRTSSSSTSSLAPSSSFSCTISFSVEGSAVIGVGALLAGMVD